METNKPKIIIVLDNIKYNNNVGPILRIADAINAYKLIICREGKLKYTNKQLLILKKISRGAIDYVNWELCQDSFSVVKELKENNTKIVSIDIRSDKYIYPINIEQNESIAIVFGSESQGINPGIIKLSDEVLKIPMMGKANSLNVATAVAIATYSLLNIQ